jgi:hypothetical protein
MLDRLLRIGDMKMRNLRRRRNSRKMKNMARRNNRNRRMMDKFLK